MAERSKVGWTFMSVAEALRLNHDLNHNRFAAGTAPIYQ